MGTTLGMKLGPLSERHRAKISKALKNFCRNNPERSFQIRSSANKGKIPWNKGLHWSEEIKKKMSDGNKRYLKEHPEDIRFTSIRKGAKHTPETREKMSISVSKAIREGRMDSALSRYYISGDFYSKKNKKWMHYRSRFELYAYELLEQIVKVVAYEVEPFSIKYKKEIGVVGRYTPDLLVIYTDGSRQLIEVKPKIAVDNETVQKKTRAAERYCKRNNMEFSIWTEDQVFKHKLKKEPLRVQ